MCQSVKRYANPKIKYMKNYDKKIESSYLTYLDADTFAWMGNVSKITCKWVYVVYFFLKFTEDFTKNYDGNSDVGYFLEEDVRYRKKLWCSRKDLPSLPERKKLEKVEELVCSIESKEKYFIH